MPDPIFTAGPLPTPLTYTVPGTGEVVPIACQAVFDGSGAGGSYIPAVIFRSQAGHVISRAILESTIAAGDDAEVSWFPGVKAGGSGAGATIAWGIILSGSALQTVPGDPTGLSPVYIDFTAGGVIDSGSGVFTFNVADPNFLRCSIAPSPGIFLVQAFFEHDDSTPTGVDPSLVRASLRFAAPVGGGDSDLDSETLLGANQGTPPHVNSLYSWGASGMQSTLNQTTPVGFGIELVNYSAAGKDLEATAVTIMVSLVAA